MTYDGLRSSSLAELSQWHPAADRQRRLAADYLELIRAGDSALRKDGGPSHVTASALVFDRSARRVLLTLHRKARAWMQFGGHLEPHDTSLAAAAAREAREESGFEGIELLPGIWRLDRHRLGGRFGTCREHLDVQFVGVAHDAASIHVSDESIDVAWFSIDDLPADIVPDLPPWIPQAAALLS